MNNTPSKGSEALQPWVSDLAERLRSEPDDRACFELLWQEGTSFHVLNSLFEEFVIEKELATQLDGLRIIRRFASGGMGQLFVALDEELEREVLVKRLYPGPDGPANPELWQLSLAERRRFLHEAKVTGGLPHSSIAPIHRILEDAHGIPYFVMRQLPGKDFAHYVADERPSDLNSADGKRWLRESIDALFRIAQAISFVHDRGIVHRDISPHNLFLGEFGEVLILDFGIAREVDRARQFAFSSVGGKFGYKAPEMWQGVCSYSIDLYSLGAVLRFVLSGDSQKNDRILSEIPTLEPRMSGPRALQEIARKALQASPRDRYSREEKTCVADFAEELRRWLNGEAIESMTERPHERLARVVRNHSQAVAVGVPLVLSLLVVAIVALVWIADARARASNTARMAVNVLGDSILKITGPLSLNTQTRGLYEASLDNASVVLDNLIAQEGELLGPAVQAQFSIQKADVKFQQAETAGPAAEGLRAEGIQFVQEAIDSADRAAQLGIELPQALRGRLALFQIELEPHTEDVRKELYRRAIADLQAAANASAAFENGPLQNALANALIQLATIELNDGQAALAIEYADRANEQFGERTLPVYSEPSLLVAEAASALENDLDALLISEDLLDRTINPRFQEYWGNRDVMRYLVRSCIVLNKLDRKSLLRRELQERWSGALRLIRARAPELVNSKLQMQQLDLERKLLFMANMVGDDSREAGYAESLLGLLDPSVVAEDAPALFMRCEALLIGSAARATRAETRQRASEDLEQLDALMTRIIEQDGNAGSDPAVINLKRNAVLVRQSIVEFQSRAGAELPTTPMPEDAGWLAVEFATAIERNESERARRIDDSLRSLPHPYKHWRTALRMLQLAAAPNSGEEEKEKLLDAIQLAAESGELDLLLAIDQLLDPRSKFVAFFADQEFQATVLDVARLYLEANDDPINRLQVAMAVSNTVVGEGFATYAADQFCSLAAKAKTRTAKHAMLKRAMSEIETIIEVRELASTAKSKFLNDFAEQQPVIREFGPFSTLDN